MMVKCVNCGGKRVGKANSDGFARCPDCNCSNIIPRPEDYAAARKMHDILINGWPNSKTTEQEGGENNH